MARAAKEDAVVQSYLAQLEPKVRKALKGLQEAVLAVAPDAVEGMSYGMPTLKLHGHAIAGFAAFADHLSFFPMSGTVLGAFKADLAGFRTAKATVHFTLEKPLPVALVKKIVRARIAELRGARQR